MSTLPYPTWCKGPSPKEVYAAFGHTYVGYLPVAIRLMFIDQVKRNRGYLTKESNIRVWRSSDCMKITSLDMRVSALRYIGYFYDSNKVYSEDLVTPKDVLDKQPRYQVFLQATLQCYPKFYGDSSFYLFEDFIINDDSNILLWAKYADVTTWAALKSLNDLPKRERQ